MNKLQEMLSELIAAKYTQSSIAEEVRSLTGGKCDQSTIGRIMSGEIARPRYDVGEAIAEMHQRLKQAA